MSQPLAPTNLEKKATFAAEQVGKFHGNKAVAFLGQVLVAVVFTFLNTFVVEPNFECPCLLGAPAPEFEEKCKHRENYAITIIAGTTTVAAILGTGALVGLSEKLPGGKKEKKSKSNNHVQNGNSSTIQEHRDGERKQKDDTESLELRERSGKSTSQVAKSADKQTSETFHDKAPLVVVDPSQGSQPKDTKKLCTIQRRCNCKEFWTGVGYAVFSALVWIAILLMDGDYFACARTCVAYQNMSCAQIEVLNDIEKPYTEEYSRIRNICHIIGYSLAAALGIILICGLICRCKSRKKCCPCLREWVDDCECCGIYCPSLKDQEKGDYEKKVQEAKKLLLEVEPQAMVVKEI